jgi:lambda repressor-like predicted transcriptional regulator
VNKTYTEDDVLAAIRKRTDLSSIRAVARELGVSAAYLCDVLSRKRTISVKVAKLFGFRRETVTEVRFLKAS